MTGPRRLLARIGHLFLRPWLRRRIGRVTVERVEGLPLVVLPEVFNPAVYRSGALLARTLAYAPLHARPEGETSARSFRALDLGTGSGVGAVFAARRGFDVVAADINPQAARCARINALLHGLEERIEARVGDLFEPVAGERFDLVLFNPPFFVGRPRDDLDAAWRGSDVLERFAAGLPAALAPRGRAWIVLSTDGAGERLLAALRGVGLGIETVARRSYGTEVLTVYQARAPRPEAGAAR